MNGFKIRRAHWLMLALLLLLIGATTLVSAGSDAPFSVQVVRQQAVLMFEDVEVGTAEYWNTRDNLIMSLVLSEDSDLFIGDVQVYASEEVPPAKKGKPIPGKFPCKRELTQC